MISSSFSLCDIISFVLRLPVTEVVEFESNFRMSFLNLEMYDHCSEVIPSGLFSLWIRDLHSKIESDSCETDLLGVRRDYSTHEQDLQPSYRALSAFDSALILSPMI